MNTTNFFLNIISINPYATNFDPAKYERITLVKNPALFPEEIIKQSPFDTFYIPKSCPDPNMDTTIDRNVRVVNSGNIGLVFST